ncbi:MAG: hypothetical protein ACXITV_02635 [Luteibaculaceae bacterium]
MENNFILELKLRNETLFYFGFICLVTSVCFLFLSKVTHIEVYKVNAWLKPFKFALSTTLFAWTMAWFIHYLPNFNSVYFNWAVIILLGFEIVYIALQASKGEISHYNNSTAFNALMFSFMAIAATLVTLYTAYIALLFFVNDFEKLPLYYTWSIRLGLLIFVVFSFQGFLMGANMGHTIGAENDNSNLPIVGWSKIAGDLRIPHFLGMHALQILPLLSYYILKSSKLTITVGIAYALFTAFTLVVALQGKPLVSS